MPKNRMNRGLAALSVSAITAIYAAGYVRTQAADAELGAAENATTVQLAPATPSTPQSAPTPAVVLPRGRAGGGSSQQTATPSLPPVTRQAPPVTQTRPTPEPSRSPAAAYKDGTYTGVGQSRRGGVQVSLTVQGGRIRSVNITRVSTEYPPSDIAPLPRQVVTRQSAQVDMVSGATYSSMAFRGAVQQALSKAQP